jgi:hypothetical protein
MGMNSRHRGGRDSEGRQSRFGSLLSLVALLLYFLLPAIYYVHLTGFPLPAESGGLKTGPPIFESRPGDPVTPHDSNACPICQAGSSFQDYGLFQAFHAPQGSALVGPWSDSHGTLGLAKLNVLNIASRAPPVMPLPQTTA